MTFLIVVFIFIGISEIEAQFNIENDETSRKSMENTANYRIKNPYNPKNNLNDYTNLNTETATEAHRFEDMYNNNGVMVRDSFFDDYRDTERSDKNPKTTKLLALDYYFDTGLSDNAGADDKADFDQWESVKKKELLLHMQKGDCSKKLFKTSQKLWQIIAVVVDKSKDSDHKIETIAHILDAFLKNGKQSFKYQNQNKKYPYFKDKGIRYNRQKQKKRDGTRRITVVALRSPNRNKTKKQRFGNINENLKKIENTSSKLYPIENHSKPISKFQEKYLKYKSLKPMSTDKDKFHRQNKRYHVPFLHSPLNKNYPYSVYETLLKLMHQYHETINRPSKKYGLNNKNPSVNNVNGHIEGTQSLDNIENKIPAEYASQTHNYDNIEPVEIKHGKSNELYERPISFGKPNKNEPKRNTVSKIYVIKHENKPKNNKEQKENMDLFKVVVTNNDKPKQLDVQSDLDEIKYPDQNVSGNNKPLDNNLESHENEISILDDNMKPRENEQEEKIKKSHVNKEFDDNIQVTENTEIKENAKPNNIMSEFVKNVLFPKNIKQDEILLPSIMNTSLDDNTNPSKNEKFDVYPLVNVENEVNKVIEEVVGTDVIKPTEGIDINNKFTIENDNTDERLNKEYTNTKLPNQNVNHENNEAQLHITHVENELNGTSNGHEENLNNISEVKHENTDVQSSIPGDASEPSFLAWNSINKKVFQKLQNLTAQTPTLLLPSVYNHNDSMVEVTYLLSHPKVFVYQPQHVIKQRIPLNYYFTTFHNMLLNKTRDSQNNSFTLTKVKQLLPNKTYKIHYESKVKKLPLYILDAQEFKNKLNSLKTHKKKPRKIKTQPVKQYKIEKVQAIPPDENLKNTGNAINMADDYAENAPLNSKPTRLILPEGFPAEYSEDNEYGTKARRPVEKSRSNVPMDYSGKIMWNNYPIRNPSYTYNGVHVKNPTEVPL